MLVQEENLKVSIVERPGAEVFAGNRLPAGTSIQVRTDSPVSATVIAAGDRLTSRIAEAVEQAGRVVASAGTEAVVRVVDSQKAAVTLRLAQIRLSAARHVEVLSEPITVASGELPAGTLLTFRLQNEAEVPQPASAIRY